MANLESNEIEENFLPICPKNAKIGDYIQVLGVFGIKNEKNNLKLNIAIIKIPK